MRNPLIAFVSLSLFLSASLVTADDKKQDKPMDMEAMMKAYQKLATPGEPHQLLASLTGKWQTTTKEWMEPGKPPVESNGSADMSMLLGGRFLRQEYTGDMMGQPYHGIGTTGYDNIGKKYVSTWIDNMSTGIFLMEGTAGDDGRTITLKGQHQGPDGGQMTHRAVWKIESPDKQTFEMYGTHDGSPEIKMMEIIYTRK